MEQPEIIITQLKTATPEICDAIRNLTKQIGKNYKELTNQDINDMLQSSCNHLIVASHKDTIIGMITVLIFRIPYVKKGYIDDLIVDENYRGQGLGKRLLDEALKIAKEKGVAYVDFTSRPSRLAGNSLYEKLGFKRRDTNIYRLVYSYDEV